MEEKLISLNVVVYMFVPIDPVSEACPRAAPNATTLSCSLWREDVSQPALRCRGASPHGLTRPCRAHAMVPAHMIRVRTEKL